MRHSWYLHRAETAISSRLLVPALNKYHLRDRAAHKLYLWVPGTVTSHNPLVVTEIEGDTNLLFAFCDLQVGCSHSLVSKVCPFAKPWLYWYSSLQSSSYPEIQIESSSNDGTPWRI